jgi:hypothetical protein
MGSESLSSFSALVALAHEREREMRDIARMEHLLAGNNNNRLSWHARFMSRLGDKLVVYGTRLKTHYSVQNAYRAN